MNRLEETVSAWPVSAMPNTLADRTRRVYDRLAAVYPVSTMFFHSRAHRCALGASGLRDGMKVLEVATGSGEMFRRLVRANARGTTVGVDLSPNMAARTQRTARAQISACAGALPGGGCPPYAVPQRILRRHLLLLPAGTAFGAKTSWARWREFRRILRDRGNLTLVLIGQNTATFNAVYKVLGKVAPAFWGRQVEQRVPNLIETARFEIVQDRMVRQTFYPSRVLVARKIVIRRIA